MVKADIIRLVKENDVRFIRLQFTDILGQLKNVAIMPSQIDRVLESGCMFDGSSIDGFVRIEESDMFLKPDLETFVIYPSRLEGGENVARIICDIYTYEGKPFEGDPRYILKKTIEKAKKMGYELHVGPELEFFLFEKEDGRPTTIPSDNGGYFDLAPIDGGENTRKEICTVLEEMGLEIEASHHEVANGQHEIDFKYGDALKTADNVVTFKMVVKTIAMQNGFHATFMPKPIFGTDGSGMHVNMSLSDDSEQNVFYEPNNGNDDLSKEAYYFIAGILEHAKGYTAITNPLVNSYKRLVPGYEAPVYIAWSAKNRSPLVRVPAARGKGTRVELRSPDPSCNPYLAFAAVLASGLDGIERELPVPEQAVGNIYNMCPEEREVREIGSLPGSLRQAIDELKKDGLICEVLGDHVLNYYSKNKISEYDEYRTNIHQWELERYLSKY